MRLPICLFIIWTGVVASRVILSSLSSTSPSASTANTTTTHHRDDSCSSHPDIRPRSPLSLPLAPRSRISRGCSEQHQDQLQYQLLGAVRVWSTEAALLAARYQSHMSQVDADLLFRINFGPDTIHNRAYVREHFRHIEREVDRSPGGEGHFHRLLPYGVSARLLTGRVTIACGESPVGHELCNEDGITYVRPVGLRRGMVVLCDRFWQLRAFPRDEQYHDWNQVKHLLSAIYEVLFSGSIDLQDRVTDPYRYAQYAQVVYFRSRAWREN